MTSEEKIVNIEKQLDDLVRARRFGVKPYSTTSLHCPYCEANNIDGKPLCCVPLGRALAAIFMRQDLKDKADQAERIAEKVTRN